MGESQPIHTASQRFATAVVATTSAVMFVAAYSSAFSQTYGYFVDEFYYIACAKRLAFGYVDHPPLAPLILRGVLGVLGDSLPAIRLLPALAGAATVLTTGWMAYRLGGGKWAQAIAALSVVVAPIPVIMFGFFSMNALELLLWTVACCILIEICRSGDRRLWIALGILLGVAFENKHTSLLLAAGIGVGTLLSPLRRQLVGRSVWIGAAVAALLMLPNLVWQATHGWVSLEFYGNLARESNIPTGPLEALATQVGATHPATFPVWAAGIVFFFSPAGRQYRALGWVFLAVLTLFTLSGASRPDRIQGAYPVLFAGGGVFLEDLCQRRHWRWVRAATPALLVAGGLFFAPLLLPFPPEIMARHPLAAGTNDTRREVGPAPIPLPFSHRLGSEEFVETVSSVYSSLNPRERREALILAGDFAHAGALEFFGPRFSLPRVFSPHNNGYLWGPDLRLAPPVTIAIGLDEALLRREFDRLDEAAVYQCRYCMGWRDQVPIYVARSPRRPLAEIWPEMRRIGLPTRKLLMLGGREASSD